MSDSRPRSVVRNASSGRASGRTGSGSAAGRSDVNGSSDNGRESRDARESRAGPRGGRTVDGLKGYQLGDCLGKGAFGSVYRALHWGSGETVAIKQIRLVDLPKSELRVIMLEIDLLKNLHHANIVKYHGFVKTADSLYIILEYCENGSLHSICKNFGKFPENLVALYLSQVLHGLLYLHDQGVIHRDIKGANILTTKEGLVKLADFGVATRTQGLSESSVVGTPYWMAPEVIELSGATTASDIWSVGCTVIELLDGKPPYHKLQPMPALFRIVSDDHPPLPEGASPACRDFLMQCFQKDPNLRVSAKKLLKHPWIASAKKADSVVPTLPTQFEQAVKSVQEWNEALRSTSSVRKPGRMVGPNGFGAGSFAGPPHDQSTVGATRAKPDRVLIAAESESDDNWDSDFPSSISSAGLRLVNEKRQDNFDGQLSDDRLKAIATFDRAETSTFDISTADPLETVRPYTPAGGRLINRVGRTAGHGNFDSTGPVPTSTLAGRSVSGRFDGLDEFDELDGFDDDGDDDTETTAMATTNRFGRLSLGSDPAPVDGVPIRLSRPAVEINQYAEREDEDFSDVFGVDDAVLPIPSVDSGSDRATHMMLNSKLSSGSWLGDDEDDDDPFAQLEEGFDDLDMATKVARDRFARLCTAVEGLVGSLKTTQPEEALADVSEQLLDRLIESPELKTVIMSAHGMLPMLEILESCQRKDVVVNLLKIVNIIICDNVEIQENLCFVGGIPIVSQFALKRYPIDIRLEAAAFVRQMYSTSTLTLQMFVSCGGLNVLVEFLEEDVDTERELVLTGVNGVWNVFELQGPTRKNDFCRILSRSTILYPLSLVLSRLVDERDEKATTIQGRIVNIFLLFSQAENYVKETIADRMTLKRILKDLPRIAHPHQITMLKFLKNMSMLSTTHDSLQNSNAIEALTDFLAASMSSPHVREISNQVLNTMYNLCRLSKTRQEDAALNGLIPLLQQIVQTEWPLKEFALPILCDIAHSGKVGRKLLWQNKGLSFYISLLADKYWQVTALDAIFVWLQEETARVEQQLLDRPFGLAIVDCFTNPDASADAFENLLEVLQKLVRLCPAVAIHLADPTIFGRVGQKLHTKKAVVRLNLLRIISTVCDVSPFISVPPMSGRRVSIIKAYHLYDAIVHLAAYDPAVLVREIGSEIIRATEAITGPSSGSIDGASAPLSLPAHSHLSQSSHSRSRLLSRHGTVGRSGGGPAGSTANPAPPVMAPISHLASSDRLNRPTVYSVFDSLGSNHSHSPSLSLSHSHSHSHSFLHSQTHIHNPPRQSTPVSRLPASVTTPSNAASPFRPASRDSSAGSITSGLHYQPKSMAGPGSGSRTPGRFSRVGLGDGGGASASPAGHFGSGSRAEMVDENSGVGAGLSSRPKGLVLKRRTQADK